MLPNEPIYFSYLPYLALCLFYPYTFHHLSFGMACGNNLCQSRVVCNGFAFLLKEKTKESSRVSYSSVNRYSFYKPTFSIMCL